MARYRKIEVATWGDDRFRALSAPQPNAQTLWMYLLCGPRTTALPGLIIASDLVMAADLGWSVKAFREAFQEVSAKALAKADWKAGLVVLSKALFDSTGEPRETQKPQSPNVIKAWSKGWDEVPECALKDEYLQTLGAFTKALGKAFAEAFQEAFRKALLKGCRHPSRNQDQYSGDQEQDTGSPPIAPQGGHPPLELFKSKVDAVVGDIGRRRARGRKPEHTPEEIAQAQRVVAKLSEHSNIAYRGSEKHIGLIVDRLRGGYTELDLRAVIVYCAYKKGWKGDPKMEDYLRPSTLFGPEKIEEYIDAARTWAAREYPDEFKQPDAALAEPPWMAGSAS